MSWSQRLAVAARKPAFSPARTGHSAVAQHAPLIEASAGAVAELGRGHPPIPVSVNADRYARGVSGASAWTAERVGPRARSAGFTRVGPRAKTIRHQPAILRRWVDLSAGWYVNPRPSALSARAHQSSLVSLPVAIGDDGPLVLLLASFANSQQHLRATAVVEVNLQRHQRRALPSYLT
jgi:hypothetical protein